MQNIGKQLFLALFICLGSSAMAQTSVVKANAAKSNNFGIQYVLPKTELQIHIEYTKTDSKAGQYARFAPRYLGVSEQEVTQEDQTVYAINKISVTTVGIPDTSETYLVEFKSRTTAPFVYLTEDGMLCAINTEYIPEAIPARKTEATPDAKLSINPQSVYTEEYLRAGSATKMAEVAAKQIYRIRESRSDILTGDADNAPRDGEAMRIILDNLEAQEQVWTELFLGSSTRETLSATFVIEPTADLEKEVVCRFSKHNGIVDSDDLSGSPIYLNLKNQHSVEIREEDPKRKAKEPQSVVYNVPGKASVEILFGTKSVYKSTVDITQFGTKQILATSIFEDKKAPVQVLFYPQLGAIRQIIQ